MALGAYGIRRPADALPVEMEVIVHYRANRDASTTYSVTQLQAAQVLQPHKHNAGTEPQE